MRRFAPEGDKIELVNGYAKRFGLQNVKLHAEGATGHMTSCILMI